MAWAEISGPTSVDSSLPGPTFSFEAFSAIFGIHSSPERTGEQKCVSIQICLCLYIYLYVVKKVLCFLEKVGVFYMFIIISIINMFVIVIIIMCYIYIYLIYYYLCLCLFFFGGGTICISYIVYFVLYIYIYAQYTYTYMKRPSKKDKKATVSRTHWTFTGCSTKIVAWACMKIGDFQKGRCTFQTHPGFPPNKAQPYLTPRWAGGRGVLFGGRASSGFVSVGFGWIRDLFSAGLRCV